MVRQVSELREAQLSYQLNKMVEKEKRIEKKKIVIATAAGKDIPISTKQAVAICSFIKGKSPQESIVLLENVIRKKIAIPMKGEIPHRRNMPKGKPSGRYPVKASKQFIKLLRNLIANATTKGLDPELLIISKAIANKASRPYRGTRIAFGRKRLKRTHINLEVVEGKPPKPKEKRKEKDRKEEEKE